MGSRSVLKSGRTRTANEGHIFHDIVGEFPTNIPVWSIQEDNLASVMLQIADETKGAFAVTDEIEKGWKAQGILEDMVRLFKDVKWENNENPTDWHIGEHSRQMRELLRKGWELLW